MLFRSTILLPFVQQCKVSYDRPAFVLEEAVYSYGQLARCIALQLNELQEIETPYIGVYVDEQIQSYAAIWAIWFSGKTAVPIVRNISDEREALILADCSPITLFTPLCSTLNEIDRADLDLLMNRINQWPSDETSAIVLYTSGSTGVPKGAALTGMNLAAFYEAFKQTPFDWHQDDRCLQIFDLSFDFSLLLYMSMWLAGGAIYGVPKGAHLTTYLYDLLTEKKLTILPIVPTVLNYLKPYFSELENLHLRQLMVGGESVPVSLIKAWYEEVPVGEIYTPYGPTECSMLSTIYHYPRHGEVPDMGSFSSIGTLFSGMKGLVLNDEGLEVALDTPGELYLSGPQVSPGYINRAQLTAERFVWLQYKGELLRFYRTGDWVIPRSDGRFDFIGRKDNQIKLRGGYRVELGEIEAVVEDCLPSCRNMAVPIINKLNNVELLLVIESEVVDIKLLKETLQERLPQYMWPLDYYFLPEFPLNQNKKTNRPVITAWAQEKFDKL